MPGPPVSTRSSPELLTPLQMEQADRLAIAAGVSGVQLMNAAGRAVAHAVMQRVEKGRALVLCGPGNNGGDGFVAARYLRNAGWQVDVACLTGIENLTGDAAHHAALWQGPVLSFRDVADDVACNVVIDAVFGAGLSRPLPDNVAGLLQRFAATGTPVCAVDVPSGLDGATGRALGHVTPASFTVTFFRFKPGHCLMPGRSLCGERVLADIGIPASVLPSIGCRVAENGPHGWLHEFPWPADHAHKYQRGHVLVIGSAQMTGASRLAAMAAGRMGAGLVTVAVPAQVWPVYAASLLTVMVEPLQDSDDLAPALNDVRRNTVVAGPGAGCSERTRRQVLQVLHAARPTVLDADALSAFADDPGVLLRALHDQCVLTPHAGEFARLFDSHDDKLGSALHAARTAGCVVVYKGPDTVIAAPDGRAAINTNAPAVLATGGTGDVLAGFIAGLLAQGMPTFQAACAAVWLHGEAAARVGQGLLAHDLPDALPQVLQTLHSRATR